ncbi:substrate-binding domain-containing protein [Micromonospora sp. NBRC 101691]|uniref:PstS family phosphate ABC transporter substrate-binding protein n=1 Tax=Micromonospora sp. NBRC 101691 TaxID=3032198 RepID=UPI0024A22972|nr:substrate-binding domain-containing protein [Micromonospora sp. NBRC 101691]GLY23109.1 phosphate ABC transporter substrate-binding protein [Micromonospora sp. NBRC 101691]
MGGLTVLGSIREWAVWALVGGDTPVGAVLLVLLLTVSWQVWREIRARRAARKRLSYHVSFNSRLGFDPPDAGEITRLLDRNGEPVPDPSMVVIRISNTGTNDIAETDYQLPLKFDFGSRTVRTVDVSEGVPPALEEVFAPHIVATEHGVVVPDRHLNAGSRFKLLILLSGNSADSTVRTGGVLKGGDVVDARHEQKNRIRYWRAGTAVVASLCVGALAAVGFGLPGGPAGETTCVDGTLRAVGSSAFATAAAQAIGSYEAFCADSTIESSFTGSRQGVEELQKSDGDVVAFSDGPEPGLDPGLVVGRPLAVIQFSVVVHPAVLGRHTGALDLSAADLRKIFGGTARRWPEVRPGLADLPIRIVGRRSQSGSRVAFERYVLGRNQGALTSTDCAQPDDPGSREPTLCEVSTTEDVLDRVSGLPGAIGYAGTPDALKVRNQLVSVTIDGRTADPDDPGNGYPFWTVEYVYHRRHPTGQPSLAESFVTYLTEESQAQALARAGYPACRGLGLLCPNRT